MGRDPLDEYGPYPEPEDDEPEHIQLHRAFIGRQVIAVLIKIFGEERKTGSERFICSACREKYILPRQCYPCRHTFCEPCLRKLAQETIAKGGWSYRCPVCVQGIHFSVANMKLEAEIKQHGYESGEAYAHSLQRMQLQERISKLPLPGMPFTHLFRKYYARRAKPTTDELITHIRDELDKTLHPMFFWGVLDMNMAAWCLLILNGVISNALGQNSTANAATVETLNQTQSTQQFGNFSAENSSSMLLSASAEPQDNADYLKFPLKIIVTLLAILATRQAIEFATGICHDLRVGIKTSSAILIALFLVHMPIYVFLGDTVTGFMKRHSYDAQSCLVFASSWLFVVFVCSGNLIWRRKYVVAAIRLFRGKNRHHNESSNLSLESGANSRRTNQANRTQRRLLDETNSVPGPGQISAATEIALPAPARVQLSLRARDGVLWLEIIRIRGLTKLETKTTPAFLVETFLYDGRSAPAEVAETGLSERTLTPFFGQKIILGLDYEEKILQLNVWSVNGKITHRGFVGTCQIQMSLLNVAASPIINAWYAISDPPGSEELAEITE